MSLGAASEIGREKCLFQVCGAGRVPVAFEVVFSALCECVLCVCVSITCPNIASCLVCRSPSHTTCRLCKCAGMKQALRPAVDYEAMKKSAEFQEFVESTAELQVKHATALQHTFACFSPICRCPLPCHGTAAVGSALVCPPMLQ